MLGNRSRLTGPCMVHGPWSTVKAKVLVRLAMSNNQSQSLTTCSTSLLITGVSVDKCAINHQAGAYKKTQVLSFCSGVLWPGLA